MPSKKVFLFFFWIIFIIAAYGWLRSINALPAYDIALVDYPQFLQQQVKNLGAIAPLIYILGYTIRPIILFPATIFTALAGLLFGPWWGFLFAFVGENFSANLAYFLGRYFGADIVQTTEGSRTDRIITYLRDRGFITVLMMRLLYFPFDFTNYICGVARISWPQYALATALGTIPGLTVFLLIGSALGTGEMGSTTFQLLLSGGIFVLSLILSRVLSTRYNSLNKLKEEVQ